MEEFATIGLDAVVGSVGNGSTLRLISDIEGVKYTEGRFLPYFFPDTFHAVSYTHLDVYKRQSVSYELKKKEKL